MTLTHKLTHVADGLKHLAYQFQDLPNFEAILIAWLNRIQEIEDVLWELIDERTIDAAVGVQLDGIGAIVGEPRLGKTDDKYRLFIKARRLVNLSSGTVPELIEILGLLTENTIEYRVEYPAGFSLIVADILALPESVALILSDAVVAGVAVHLNYADVLDTAAFTFATGDAVEASATLGWADDTPVTAGGFWADVLEIA